MPAVAACTELEPQPARTMQAPVASDVRFVVDRMPITEDNLLTCCMTIIFR